MDFIFQNFPVCLVSKMTLWIQLFFNFLDVFCAFLDETSFETKELLNFYRSGSFLSFLKRWKEQKRAQ